MFGTCESHSIQSTTLMLYLVDFVSYVRQLSVTQYFDWDIRKTELITCKSGWPRRHWAGRAPVAAPVKSGWYIWTISLERGRLIQPGREEIFSDFSIFHFYINDCLTLSLGHLSYKYPGCDGRFRSILNIFLYFSVKLGLSFYLKLYPIKSECGKTKNDYSILFIDH